jgi:hypothetical protein
MAIRVTTPITKYGRYYAAGEIIDEPTSVERSLARLLQWEQVDDPKPTLGGLRKAQLVDLAVERGVDVEGLTKAEIIELLEG